MYKPSNHLVIPYLLTYLPIYETYTKVKPDTNSVEVRPQASDNMHPVPWWVLVHCFWSSVLLPMIMAMLWSAVLTVVLAVEEDSLLCEDIFNVTQHTCFTCEVGVEKTSISLNGPTAYPHLTSFFSCTYLHVAYRSLAKQSASELLWYIRASPGVLSAIGWRKVKKMPVWIRKMVLAQHKYILCSGWWRAQLSVCPQKRV
jgi:hypothetical protein